MESKKYVKKKCKKEEKLCFGFGLSSLLKSVRFYLVFFFVFLYFCSLFELVFFRFFFRLKKGNFNFFCFFLIVCWREKRRKKEREREREKKEQRCVFVLFWRVRVSLCFFIHAVCFPFFCFFFCGRDIINWLDVWR